MISKGSVDKLIQVVNLRYIYLGCTKLRNEIETQRTKRNESKRNITQQNILKCETKRNETKYTKMRNATEYTKMQNETKIY